MSDLTVLTPTPEQDDCIGLFLTGDPLVIEAGAGTGKTSTLELISRSTERLGTYVAFNRAIVYEASHRFPMNITSVTAHGLAMRAVGGPYRDRLPTQRVASARLGKWLGIDPVIVRYDDKDKRLQPGYLASLVLKGIARWCATAEPEPKGHHIPWVNGIDMVKDGHRSTHNNSQLRAYLEPHLAVAWADLTNPKGRLPFTHDHYLKMWQLSGPTIPGDFVLFDEAQDATPVMLDAVASQAARGAQLVFVGDTQQQIYEWRGAVNALATLEGQRAFLTQSWRFGPAIAEVANVLLEELNAEIRLIGSPHLSSTISACTPRAVLCRSNVGAIDTVLKLQRAGRHPHLVGGGEEVVRFAKAVQELQETGSTGHPELACFESWAEVLAYVDQDPQGDELALMVHLLQEYGLAIILDALDGMIAENEADTIVSTAHKAKGREWPTVRISGDYPEPEIRGLGADGELRLLYVAATRARDTLDLRACEPLAHRFATRMP
jgi:hypothetical protein